LVRFWVGWIILFYFISNLMTSAKNIINFQFTMCVCVCVCVPLFLHLVGINRPWQDEWMVGRMWSIISSIYPVIAGLWHVCHLFLLLSLSRHVCSPLFFHPSSKQTMTRQMNDRTNGQMDDETYGWNDVSWRPLLYVIIWLPEFTKYVIHIHQYFLNNLKALLPCL